MARVHFSLASGLRKLAGESAGIQSRLQQMREFDLTTDAPLAPSAWLQLDPASVDLLMSAVGTK